MDSNLKREIIVDNYQNPVNRKIIDDDSFIVASTISDSCIDNITLYVKFKDDVIMDIYFDGEACAITTSATSIMIKMLIGKTIDYANKLMENYYSMIDEGKYDETILGELNAYDGISKQPNRKKCAIFPFETLKKVIKKYKENK
jgi:nitrogen fixation NifU-like protein